MPAKHLKAMLPALLPTWLPEGLRPVFEQACLDAKRRTPPEWDALFATKRADLEKLLLSLADWQDVDDWEIRLLGIDPALLLFYVMKIQAAALSLLALPDDAMVPATTIEETWRWMTALRPDESWLNWFVVIRDPHPSGLPLWPYSKN